MPEIPDWFRPVAEYMLREGLPVTLKIAAVAVTASALIGILLGTLMTINFLPLRSLIRLYIEVWRGIPILVTVLFIYWLPAFDLGPFRIQMNAYTSAAVGLTLWGSAQVAEATRGAVQIDPEGAARGCRRARARVDRPARVRDRPPGRSAGCCRRWSGCS